MQARGSESVHIFLHFTLTVAYLLSRYQSLPTHGWQANESVLSQACLSVCRRL